MSCVGFEAAIPAIERPQTFALDHMTTGIGVYIIYIIYTNIFICVYSNTISTSQHIVYWGDLTKRDDELRFTFLRPQLPWRVAVGRFVRLLVL